MRVLVLGGTGFVGRWIVDRLLTDGHEPVLFNRGTGGLFPGVERVAGDRDTGDYAGLRGGRWDAVVDVTAYFPWQVRQAMHAVGDEIDRYLLVSSHVVFDGAGPALRPAVTDATRPLTDATYGPSKVACEQEVTARYGDRATVVRPCKVAGPHDNQSGLTHWIRATARGGRVELPGDPVQPVQLVDVRDVAALVVRLLTGDRGGAYTAAGPTTTLGDLVAACAAAAGTHVDIVRVPPVPRCPLVKDRADWVTQHRTPAAEMTITPLGTTIRDVRASGGAAAV